MKTLLFLALALLTVSCSTKRPAVGEKTIPRVAETRSVVPRAHLVRTEIVEAKETTTELKVGLDAALEEINRLREKASLTKDDLDFLVEKVKSEKDRVIKLLAQLKKSEGTIATLTEEAAASDTEITSLRSTVDTLNSRLIAAEKWESEAADKVAVYDFFQKWTVFALVILGIVAVLFVAIRFGPALLRLVRPL